MTARILNAAHKRTYYQLSHLLYLYKPRKYIAYICI